MRQLAKRGLALLLTLMLTASLLGNGLVIHAATPEDAISQAAESPEDETGLPAEEAAGPSDATPDSSAPAGDEGDPTDGDDTPESSLEPEAEDEGPAEPEDPLAQAGYTLDELLAAARESGASAAELLNGTADEAAYHAGLSAVLDLYYGDKLYDLLDAFAAGIDGRAAETLAKYAEARAERETEQPVFVPGEVLVVFKPQVSEAAAEGVLMAQAATVVDELLPEEPEVAVVAEVPLDQTVAEAVEALDADPLVAFAQPNYLYYTGELAAERTNDPGAASQWHLSYVGQAAAWALLDSLPDGREPVTVAVIDTPVDLNHEDLAENLILEHARNFVGYNTVYTGTDGFAYDEPDTSVTNDSWQYYWTQSPGTHGTHVAGILGALANNGRGGIGVGSGSENQLLRIMPLNAFSYGLADGASTPSYTGASSTAVGLAINYAKRNGAKVINLSLGSAYAGADSYMEKCINSAVAAGVTVVAAAGNAKSGSSALEWLQDEANTGRYQPSDFENTISVINLARPATTTYQQDGVNVRSPASNYGGKDIAAPGAGIYSTYPSNSYEAISGTSMATPIVSAVAAMLYYVDPDITPAEVRRILQATATDVYKAGYDSHTAWGCVDAEMAVRAAITAPRNLSAQLTAGDTAVALSWDAVDEAVYYEVTRTSLADDTLEVLENVTGTSFTDSTLQTDDIYSYRVRAHFEKQDRDIAGGWSEAVEAALPLAAPTGLATANAAGGDIVLSWTPNPAATGYKVMRYLEGEEDASFLVNGGSTGSYTDRGTGKSTLGTTYEYRIYSLRRLSSAGKPQVGGLSQAVSDTRTAPVPQDMAAAPAGLGSVALSWSPVPNTDSYLIQRSANGGDFKDLKIVTVGTAYTDNTCAADALYQYRVLSRASRGETVDSEWSGEALGYTLMATPAFTGVQAPSGGTVELAWGAVPGAQQYEVWRSPDGSAGELIATVATTSYTDEDPTLAFGVKVNYWLRALREVDTQTGTLQHSGDSAQQSAVPFLSAAGPRVDSSRPGALKMSWEAVPGATGYIVYRATLSPAGEGPADVEIDRITATSYTDTGYWQLVEYRYTIVPYVSRSGIERLGTPAVLAAPVSLEPLANLRVQSANNSDVTLVWDGLEGHPFADDIVYTLQRRGGAGFAAIALPAGHGASYADAGLELNTTYSYSVTARLAGHETGKSGSCAVETNLAMDDTPLVVASAGYDSLRVEWAPVADAHGYTVLRATSPLGPFALAAVVPGGASGSFTDTGLATGTPYYYRVHCFTYENPADSLSPRFSSLNHAESAAPTAPVPAAPAQPDASAPDGAYDTLALSWPAVAGASGYSIYRVAEGGTLLWEKDTRATVTAHTFTGLAGAGPYTYVVRAWRTVGKTRVYGPQSATATATPSRLPAVGDSFTAVETDAHRVWLSWDNLAVATGYTLYRAPQAAAADPAGWTRLKSLAAGKTAHTDAGVPTGEWAYIIVPKFSVGGKTCNGAAQTCAVTVAPWAGFTSLDEAQRTPAQNPDKPHQVTLKWTPVPNATGYRVYRDGVLAATVKKGGATGYTQTGVPAGSYQYTVTAYISVGGKLCESTPGVYEPVTVESPVGTVDDLKATAAADHTVKLTWTPADKASGYGIYRKLPGQAEWTLLKNVNSKTLAHTDKAVPADYTGAKAAYRVTAYLAVSGKKLYGEPAEATVNVTGLEPVAGFKVAPGTGADPGKPHAATFSWNALPEASGYYLQRAPGRDGPYTTEATLKAGRDATVSTTLTSLPDGEWYFRVVAYLTVGGKKMEGDTDPKLARQATVLALAAPGSATATTDGLTHSLKLAWGKVEGATGYTIYRAEDAGGTYLPVATAKAGKNAEQQLTLKGQSMGSRHYMVVPTFTVKKVTFTGAGAHFTFAGDADSVQGLPAPEGVMAQISGLMGVEVRWEKVAGASGYFVYEVDADAHAADPHAALAAGVLRATVSGGKKTSVVVIAPATPNADGTLMLDDGAEARYLVVPYYKYGKLLLAGSGRLSTDTITADWAYELDAEGALSVTIEPGGLYTTRITTRHALTGPTGFAIRQAAGGATSLLKNVKTGRSTTTKAYSAAAETAYTVTLYRTAAGQTVEWEVAKTTGAFEVQTLAGGSGLAVDPAGNAARPAFSWDRVDGAAGYYLYRAPFENAAGVRVKTVAQPKAGETVTAKSIAVPKAGAYYYYVVPYVKAGGKTYTGPASPRQAYSPG